MTSSPNGVRAVDGGGDTRAPAPVRVVEVPVASVREPWWRVAPPNGVCGADERALRSSVRASGVLVPLRLRPCDGGYEVISGARRLRSAQRAGIQTVPAEVVDADDVAALLGAWDAVVRDGVISGGHGPLHRLLVEAGISAEAADAVLVGTGAAGPDDARPAAAPEAVLAIVPGSQPDGASQPAAGAVVEVGVPASEPEAVRDLEELIAPLRAEAGEPTQGAPGRRRGWGRSLSWRLGALVVGALAAYHFTLLTFLDNLRLDTPLAYLPLMPLFAMGTALITLRRFRGTRRPIQDRQLDLLIGLPLLAGAFVLITVVPAWMSTFYWSERPDVLSFALFVIGAVVLVHGVTWAWRVRGSLAFLVLMWPALYLHAGASFLDRLSTATNTALATLLAHLPVGASSSAESGSFVIHSAGHAPLTVTVGSACAGGNAVLGAALLGSAVLLNRSGARWRKAAWLCFGMLLAFVGNLVRLVSIVALAAHGHPALALGAYHDIIGLVVFAMVTAVLLATVDRFGLRRRPPLSPAPAVAAAGPAMRWRAVVALIIAGGTVAAIGVADQRLQVYAAFVDGTGLPRMAGLASATAALPGWSSQQIATFNFQQYYGVGSTSERYVYLRRGATPIFADVVRTPDAGALDTYNLQNCFLFHNFDIRSSGHVSLDNGVTALVLDYQEPDGQHRWSTLSWAWPVRQGDRTVYERVALSLDLAGTVPPAPPGADPAGVGSSGPLAVLDWLRGGRPAGSGAYSAADAALANFGREVVSTAVHTG